MKLPKEDSPGTKRWLRPAGVNEKSSPDEVANPRFCGGEGMEVHGMGCGTWCRESRTSFASIDSQ